MAFEEHRVGARPPAGPRRSTVRIVPAHVATITKPEFRVAGDRLEITLAAADVPQPQFRYALKSRYLLVWADRGGHSQHHFVPLPRRIDPKDHQVSFANGVVDVSAKLA